MPDAAHTDQLRAVLLACQDLEAQALDASLQQSIAEPLVALLHDLVVKQLWQQQQQDRCQVATLQDVIDTCTILAALVAAKGCCSVADALPQDVSELPQVAHALQALCSAWPSQCGAGPEAPQRKQPPHIVLLLWISKLAPLALAPGGTEAPAPAPAEASTADRLPKAVSEGPPLSEQLMQQVDEVCRTCLVQAGTAGRTHEVASSLLAQLQAQRSSMAPRREERGTPFAEQQALQSHDPPAAFGMHGQAEGVQMVVVAMDPDTSSGDSSTDSSGRLPSAAPPSLDGKACGGIRDRPAAFRPPGAPAGTWPCTPWYVCVLYDPYERINVWSHGLPAICFLVLGLLAVTHVVPGGMALFWYCMCTMATHGSSMLTHVWPDSHALEKLDHLCIICTLVGTCWTAVMVVRPGGPYWVIIGASVVALVAAFLKPLWRTLGFVVVGAVLFVAYIYIIDGMMLAEILLNLVGGFFFVRNGGHERPLGLQDHHILHYCVTAAACIQVAYIQYHTAHGPNGTWIDVSWGV